MHNGVLVSLSQQKAGLVASVLDVVGYQGHMIVILA